MILRSHQKQSFLDCRAEFAKGKRAVVFVSPTGAGKCLGIGTLVLKRDGSIVAVEDIVVGDELMGPDSKPRRVLSVTRGRGKLYRVTPRKGTPWVCNEDHVLTLVHTSTDKIVDIDIRSYLAETKDFRRLHKQFGVAVRFDNPLAVSDAYTLGICISAGDSVAPLQILRADRTARLRMLAGILDDRGHMTRGGYAVRFRRKRGIDDVLYLARSLGFRATHSSELYEGIWYRRVFISGDCSVIPTKRQRAPKRKQIKDVLRTAIDVRPIGRGEYAGFELDGDGRFLLGDFTVTHNTVVAAEIIRSSVAKGNRVLFLAHREELIRQSVAKLEAAGIPEIRVIRAGNITGTAASPVTVASIPTLTRWKADLPKAELVVIDECFPAGTLVDGRPIETIKVGDVVKCFDGKRITESKVTRCFSSKSRSFCTVYFGDRSVTSTSDHPIYTNNGWKTPPYIASGDCLLGEHGEWLRPDNVDSDWPLHDVPVYNLEVEHHHNYFANGILVHNCHHTVAKTWKSLAVAYSGSRLLGLTATPQRADGKPLGDVFDALVVGATVAELTALGHLVPCRVIAPIDELNSGEQAMDTGCAYSSYAPGRKAVIFCSTIEQATAEARAFPVPCEVIHGGLSRTERTARLQRFSDGETMAIASVHALSEGWDAPIASACILLRRPAHAGTFLQMVGRILRPCVGKTDAVVIDLCGSSLKHGTPDMPRDYTLDGKGISADRKKISQCQFCGAVYQAKPGPCPACGKATPSVGRTSFSLDVVDAEMDEIGKSQPNILMRNLLMAEKMITPRPGQGWVDRAYARIAARYGV